MRTRTRVCLLALCAALLTGCGGPTEGAKAYDPAAAAQALLDRCEGRLAQAIETKEE